MPKPTGYTIYAGPSALDGAPIVVILTGFGRSANRKTGAMLQTWILRTDRSPVEAVRDGSDSAICGACPHRGDGFRNRSCYVNVGQAPLAVFRAYRRGRYPLAESEEVRTLTAGRLVRIGSYGDPGAVPTYVWQHLTTNCAGRTGYTHQWRRRPDLAPFCMASVETHTEAFEARTLGFRTFRVSTEPPHGAAPEFTCPASAEAGHRLTCDSCLACNGRKGPADLRASVTIRPHGPAALSMIRRNA